MMARILSLRPKIAIAASRYYQWLRQNAATSEGPGRQSVAVGKPPAGQQTINAGLQETVVNQPDHAPVVRGADHPAGGLGHFLQAGDQVGVVVAFAKTLLQAVFEDFMPGIERWQTEGGHEGADQLVAGQVDAFTEYAAEYREGY